MYFRAAQLFSPFDLKAVRLSKIIKSYVHVVVQLQP